MKKSNNKVQQGDLVSLEKARMHIEYWSLEVNAKKGVLLFLKQELNSKLGHRFLNKYSYIITFLGPKGNNIKIYCDMTIDGLKRAGRLTIIK